MSLTIIIFTVLYKLNNINGSVSNNRGSAPFDGNDHLSFQDIGDSQCHGYEYFNAGISYKTQ